VSIKSEKKQLSIKTLKTGIWLLGTGRYLQILDSIVIGGYLFVVTPNTIPITK